MTAGTITLVNQNCPLCHGEIECVAFDAETATWEYHCGQCVAVFEMKEVKA